MSFPQHILVINVFFAPYSFGGATVVAEEVAQELVRSHGRRITTVSAMSRGDLAPYAVMKVEKHGIQNYLVNLPAGRGYAEIYTNPQVTEIVAGLLDDLQPDLVHAHCIQEIGVGILPMIKRRGVPLVLSVHDFWWLCERQFMIRANGRYCAQDPVRVEACRGCVDDWPRARLRQETLLAMAGQADLITYPSQFAHDLSVRSDFVGPRMAIWKNGVRGPDLAFFEAQEKRRAADDRLVFGFVGGPSAIKGWPVIRAGFAGLKRDDFGVIVVEGSLDGSWWRDQDLSGLPGDWRVHPRYSQAEMDAFYTQIDVLLFMSQWKETFGLAIREAVARGIRVLQTDSGGTTEWDGADRATMLQIGDGADKLKPHLEALLDAGPDHPAPRPMTSYADQAAELLQLIAPLAPAAQSGQEAMETPAR